MNKWVLIISPFKLYNIEKLKRRIKIIKNSYVK